MAKTSTATAALPRVSDTAPRIVCNFRSAVVSTDEADQRLADFLLQLETIRRKHEAAGYRFLDSQGKELPIL